MTGDEVLKLSRKHVGEKYVLGIVAPKSNFQWRGPWDCAEFASWLIFQAAGFLYGCSRNDADPAVADAFTGFWARDAGALGQRIGVDRAARTFGAAVLRIAQPGAIGHIVISDGEGGTVEAHSTKRGVIESSLGGRRWDTGVLVPGLTYREGAPAIVVAPPKTIVLRLTAPPMTGPEVRAAQRALKTAGFNPGPIDGEFGALTHAAVVAFQASRGLIADGEIGAKTARALDLELPPS